MSKQVSHGYFVLRRFHSLLGIFPIGVFLVWHLSANSFAFGGPESFDKFVGVIKAFPLLWLLQLLLIALPILFHAVLGLVIFYTGKNNFLEYGYYKNWAYFLQRITGFIVLIFIVLHVWQTNISSALDGKIIRYADMQRIFQPSWVKFFYVVALVAMAFHFANGIRGVLITWGVTVSERSQRVAVFASWGLFGLIGFWGLVVMWVFV